ncbi:MAG: hypothetical protein ACUVXI_04275 [bacterium]
MDWRYKLLGGEHMGGDRPYAVMNDIEGSIAEAARVLARGESLLKERVSLYSRSCLEISEAIRYLRDNTL